MTETDVIAAEIFEERAAIAEFDGLLDRRAAEALAQREVEEYRHLCEVRHVLSLPTREERKAYVDLVAKMRGEEAAEWLKQDILKAWQCK